MVRLNRSRTFSGPNFKKPMQQQTTKTQTQSTLKVTCIITYDKCGARVQKSKKENINRDEVTIFFITILIRK